MKATRNNTRLALPKGRMQDAVFRLLADAGLPVGAPARSYRPDDLPGFETKILKPQNILEMLHHRSRDVGFAGADWVAELGVEVVELLDTGLDPVRVVAAVPESLLGGDEPPDAAGLTARLHAAKSELVVASEYENLAQAWIRRRGLQAEFVRSYGATEVFPPEDADCIVDNTASGATLAANGLVVVDELMTSTTRLYASPEALRDPGHRQRIDDLVLLLRSVLEARKRVMLELNVAADRLQAIIEVLPCMREPTIATLHGDSGYAVKAAVLRHELPALIPLLRSRGGTDLVVSSLEQIVP